MENQYYKLKLAMGVAVWILMMAFSMTAYAGLQDGLVSAWLFEEIDGNRAMDSAGQNHGEIHGGVQSVDGKIGKALHFNGVDSFVSITDNKTLRLPNAMTVAAWINVTEFGDHAGICFKGEQIGWGIMFSFRIATSLLDAGPLTWGRCSKNVQGDFFTPKQINPGSWYHVALVSDGTANKPYIDGEDLSATALAWDGQPSQNVNTPGPYEVFSGIPVEIGVGRGLGGQQGNDTFYSGSIDEVLIYNRALGAEELKALADGAVAISVGPATRLATTWSRIKTQ